MLRNTLFLLLFFATHTAFTQTGSWVWMKGSNFTNQLGQYGTQGVASASNSPCNRYQNAFWRDLDGNLWIFGGQYKTGGNTFYLNDLWKYDITINQWTWMKGPQFTSNPNGDYGILGVSASSNLPCARGNGILCWTDNYGKFWLYGGETSAGVLGDLWQYNLSNNEWTWINGSQSLNTPAVFGTQQVANSSNTPGSRKQTQSCWVDNLNNLWFHGGNKLNNQNKFYDDLWKYNITNNQWTWMKGTIGQNFAGTYGVKGVEAANNLPPGRWAYSKWKDKFGNLYNFGGLTSLGIGTVRLNDVWKYNGFTNNWTWISGSNSPDHPGTYGPYCVADSFKYPPSRYENQSAQPFNCTDIFWTFGGRNTAGSFYNDLWLFNTINSKWSLISGNTTPNSNGNYGIQGISSPSNMISARAGCSMWNDNENNIWVFGGQNMSGDFLSDLWKYTPDTSCFQTALSSTLNLQAPLVNSICQNDTVPMGIPIFTNVTWFPNAGVTTNSDTTILNFSPSATTTYTVIGNNSILCQGTDTISFTINVTPNSQPNIAAPTDTNLCLGESTSIALDPNLNVSYFPTQNVVPNSDTSLLNFTPNITTNYTLIASYGTCSVIDTLDFTIQVNTSPIINLVAPNPLNLCEGSSTTMFLNPNYNISISPLTNVATNADTSQLVFSPLSSTTYTIVATTSGFCADTSDISFTIQVDTPVKINLPTFPNLNICQGEEAIFNLPSGLKIVSIFPTNNAALINSNQSILFNPSISTNYILIVDSSTCSISDTTQLGVIVNPSPTSQFNFSPTTTNLSNAIFTLNNTSLNANNFIWYLNDIAFSNQQQASIQINQVGDYCIKLIAINPANCSDTSVICGTVTPDPTYLFMPNAFTPNNDNLNDEFKPLASNAELLKFVIYNRFGEEVFNNASGYWGWDGKFKTVEMPAGVYFYYLKYKIKGKEEIKKGDVTLIR
jgi:gliding motility-associated-like protein